MPYKDLAKRLAYARQYDEANREQLRIKRREYARNPEVKKQRAEYRKQWAAQPEVKERLRLLHNARIRANPTKSRSYARKWNKEHPEQYLLNKRAYWHRHKAELNESRRIARKADPAKFREMEKRSKAKPDVHARKLERDHEKYANNKEKHIAYVREYQKLNAAKLAPYKKLRVAIRRAREAAAQGSCSIEQWRQRYDFYGGRCAYCWTKLAFVDAQMDHVKPIARGGSNWPSNIVPACGPCNVSKNASRWVPEMYGFITKYNGGRTTISES